jgi:hypothetical protein
VILSRWVTRFSLGRGFLPLILIPALHWRPFPVGLRPLSPCLHNVSALPVICSPEPLFALTHMHYIAQHCTHSSAPAARYLLLPIGATGAHLTARQRPCPNAQLSQPCMDSFSGPLCRFPRVGRLEGHGITVLGFPCPRRSCCGQSGCAQFLCAPL